MTNVELLKEEIKSLRQEIAALRDRLDALEAAAAVPPPGLQQMVPTYAAQAAVAATPWTINAATAPWATGAATTPWAGAAGSSGDVGFQEDGTVNGFVVHNHTSFRRKAEQGRFMVNKGGDWYCNLCSIWATDDHLISKNHVRKFNNWLYDAKVQYPSIVFDV